MGSVRILIWSHVEAIALTEWKVRIRYHFNKKCIQKIYSAREKFSCGEDCIPRTEMCTLKGESNCSQHYTKCGAVCVEKYLMRKYSNKVINSTKVQSRNVERVNWSGSLSFLWRPLPQLLSAVRGKMHARCSVNFILHLMNCNDGQATGCVTLALSASCPAPRRGAPTWPASVTASWTAGTCQMSPGWSVSRSESDILKSLDNFHKCLLISKCQVYSSDVTSVAVLFTLLLVAIFLFIYVTKRQILVIKFYGKSKLLKMHVASVHEVEMK